MKGGGFGKERIVGFKMVGSGDGCKKLGVMMGKMRIYGMWWVALYEIVKKG